MVMILSFSVQQVCISAEAMLPEHAQGVSRIKKLQIQGAPGISECQGLRFHPPTAIPQILRDTSECQTSDS